MQLHTAPRRGQAAHVQEAQPGWFVQLSPKERAACIKADGLGDWAAFEAEFRNEIFRGPRQTLGRLTGADLKAAGK